jgi:hypothetical protein
VTHGYAIGIARLPSRRNTARSEYVFRVAQLISRPQITLISRVIYIGKRLHSPMVPLSKDWFVWLDVEHGCIQVVLVY